MGQAERLLGKLGKNQFLHRFRSVKTPLRFAMKVTETYAVQVSEFGLARFKQQLQGVNSPRQPSNALMYTDVV